MTQLTSGHADARDVCGDLHAVFTLLRIQQQVEASGTGRGKLAKHYVLRHAFHGVALAVGRRLHQHIHLENEMQRSNMKSTILGYLGRIPGVSPVLPSPQRSTS